MWRQEHCWSLSYASQAPGSEKPCLREISQGTREQDTSVTCGPISLLSVSFCVCVWGGCHRHHRLFLNFLISLSLSHTPDYSLLFNQSGPQLVKGFLPKFRAGGPCSLKLTISVNTLRNTQRCVPWVFLNFGEFRRKANQGSMLTKIPGGKVDLALGIHHPQTPSG